MMLDWVLFFHLAGIIIGLGAVTVIDSLGFVSRRSKKWTQVTIAAHHVTKPLIWIGTVLVLVSWVVMVVDESFDFITIVKSIILVVLILNGLFLSLYVSPRLDALSGKHVLLPALLQRKITMSFVISFVGWWGFVLLTVARLSS